MRSWRAWTIVLVIIFIAFNIYYWKSFICTDPRYCDVETVDEITKEEVKPDQPKGNAGINTDNVDNPQTANIHPPETSPALPPPIDASLIFESHLDPFVPFSSQPLHEPDTHYPDTHVKSSKDLDTVAPTSEKATYRLTKDGVKYADSGDLWQVGIINSKPDVFLVSNTNFPDVNNHYYREYRIYALMKWILRVHRRDPKRTTPLVMVDAGSNHGLFSLVAGSSGAHTIAFEPQTHLRSIINMASRINQLSERIRILPFAVLDQFKKLAMEKVEINDGGIGGLSYNNPNALITTQTIRLDALPSFDRLFPQSKDQEKTLKIDLKRKQDKSIMEPEDLGKDYAKAIDDAVDIKSAVIPENISFRNPIHFLKIDVEGFELPALRSASKLFEKGLVEHTILEFGPPSRWDVTLPEAATMPLDQVRAKTMKEAKDILHRADEEWNFDIKLLPAIGWQKMIEFMLEHDIDLSNGDPLKKKVVQRLFAWKFDDLPLDDDEFERELESKKNLVTEFIHLPPNLIDAFIDRSESIGEMYIWFTKKDSKSPVLKKID